MLVICDDFCEVVLILAALERVANEIRDTPQKADNLTVIHGTSCDSIGRIL
jgi:hypothetical protein